MASTRARRGLKYNGLIYEPLTRRLLKVLTSNSALAPVGVHTVVKPPCSPNNLVVFNPTWSATTMPPCDTKLCAIRLAVIKAITLDATFSLKKEEQRIDVQCCQTLRRISSPPGDWQAKVPKGELQLTTFQDKMLLIFLFLWTSIRFCVNNSGNLTSLLL